MRDVPFYASIALVGALLCMQPASAEDFYAGKTLTLISPFGAGGEYDTYLRVLQRYMGRHIPGSPTVTVSYEIGAGGIRAINYAATSAPQDGTAIVMVANGMALSQVIGAPALQVSLGKFKWIGNFSAVNSVTAVLKRTGARTIDDARHQVLMIGSTGAGSTSALLPWAQNVLAGTKFKVLLGYEGAAQMGIALRSGELDGRSGSSWAAILNQMPEARDGLVIPLSQVGSVRDPLLPDVPLLTEIVGGDPARLAVARLISLSVILNRPIAVSPNVPNDRVEVLRTAFDETMQDPDFLAAIKTTGLDLTWTTGHTAQQEIGDLLAAPQDVVDEAKVALQPETK